MRGGFVAADPDVRPQSLDVWGGLVCLIPDTCFACVESGARLVEQVVLQKVVDWAHPMWRENHIYIIEESEQGSPGWRLLCTVWRAALWPREKRAGMRGSPCSPPSACRTSWGWPLWSCQMYVDVVA